LDFRVLEKRTDPAGKSATLVVDLGEKRFPLGNVAIVTSTRDFFAKVALSAANSLNPETWTKFHEGTIFRVQKDESAKEELGMAVKSQLSRYIKIELMNSSKVVPVEKIELAANMRVVVFDYTKGLNYRLYYDNASSAAIPHDDKLLSTNMSRIANATLETSLEEEQKNVAVPTPQKMVVAEPAQSGSWTKVFGIGMLLVGLVLLFVVMLRARSLRKADKHRNSRIVYTRFD